MYSCCVYGSFLLIIVGFAIGYVFCKTEKK